MLTAVLTDRGVEVSHRGKNHNFIFIKDKHKCRVHMGNSDLNDLLELTTVAKLINDTFMKGCFTDINPGYMVKLVPTANVIDLTGE